MPLKEQLNDEMKAAMKAGDRTRLSTLRMLLAEVKNAEIAKRGDLDDGEVLAVVTREAKKRKEAIEGFEKGNRPDLVEKEQAELAILEAYLPEQMSDDDLAALVRETIEEVGASGPGDLGKVMGKLMPKVKGKADGKLANQMAREMLAGSG